IASRLASAVRRKREAGLRVRFAVYGEGQRIRRGAGRAPGAIPYNRAFLQPVRGVRFVCPSVARAGRSGQIR
ncbi:hypothetical protein QSH93_25760, partial [Escherichia coli]|uniref:hypothetical protein n=1 Tax=Escherichia coli TaxID=562 RepID=UPI00256EF0BC